MSREERFWSKVATGRPEECWPWTASVRLNGYGQINLDGRNRSAHRVAYELEHGPIPSGVVIDHVCRVRACVNPDHLRLATTKQNSENRDRAGRGISGVRGVRWDAARQAWSASLTQNYRTVNLGRFATIQAAEKAAVAARLVTFTHNHLDRKATA